ncbi:MAG: hypothetical protein EXR75_04155 [Myxococcales bacterium]|nr:hypothetical protein [Myxococcales bacterium]
MKLARNLCVAALALASVGCNAVVAGGPLSSPPPAQDGLYLSTGGSPKKFQTLGFIQVRGYGVQMAGFAEAGHASFDSTIRGTLAEEAVKFGGDGVINIEFLDENPQTDAEKIQDAMKTAQSFAKGKGEIETKDRYVLVTGEVIKFKE